MDLIEDLPPAIAVKLREVLKPNEHVFVQLPGAFKEGLICTDSRCIIIKAGFMTGNTFGSNVFQLPYVSITSAEVKFGLTGYFELSSGGVQNTVKSYWNTSKGPANATAAPNSVSLVDRKMAEKFRRASEFILDRVANARSPEPQTPTGGGSIADEIAKLVGLVEKGYLTEEEFAEQKRVMLAKSGTTPTPIPRASMPEPEPEPSGPPDNLDRAIAQALRDREVVHGEAPSNISRPVFGRRSSR